MSEDTTSNTQTTSEAIPSPAQAEVVTSTPVGDTPVITTTPDPTPEPVVAAPAVADSATAETPAASTILGEDPSKTPPADSKPADETPKEDPTPSDEPAPVASYENFVLPDGVTVEPDKLGKFTEILGEHKASQALGQQLVDLFAVEAKAVREAVLAEVANSNTTAQTEKVTQWGKDFENDTEIGGNRKDTTVAAARDFINKYAGTSEQQSEFRQLMEKTGLGNHPVIIRALANANLALSEGKPLPARAAVPEVKSKTQIMYGK